MEAVLLIVPIKNLRDIKGMSKDIGSSTFSCFIIRHFNKMNMRALSPGKVCFVFLECVRHYKIKAILFILYSCFIYMMQVLQKMASKTRLKDTDFHNNIRGKGLTLPKSINK